MSLVPIVIERSESGEKAYDIFSRLLKERIIFIGSPIDDAAASLIIAQMLFLEAEDSVRDISLYINSPGGHVTAGLGIYDTMQYIRPDVSTICLGQASSIAAILLAAGTRGKRFALSHSRIMIHQPWGGTQGQASDIEIHAREILALRKDVNQILAAHTGQDAEKIEKDTDRNFFMSAEEAITYGIVDHILKKSLDQAART